MDFVSNASGCPRIAPFSTTLIPKSPNQDHSRIIISDSIDIHPENEYVCENEASIILKNGPLDSFADLIMFAKKNLVGL